MLVGVIMAVLLTGDLAVDDPIPAMQQAPEPPRPSSAPS